MKKNLFIRKHIQEIIYSKENIRINFIYSDSGVNSDDSRRKKFSEDLRGGAEENKARRAEISDTKSGINNYCGLTSGNDLLKMAGLTKPVRLVSVEIPNTIHNAIGKLLKKQDI